MEQTMIDLIDKVKEWSIERQLNDKDQMAQFEKLIEEFGELADGINKGNGEVIMDSIGDMVVVMTILLQQYNNPMMDITDILKISESKVLHDNPFIVAEKMRTPITHISPAVGFLADAVISKSEANIKFYIMTIISDLHHLAEYNDMSLEECLAYSYNQISDRKGEIIDGKFVKESDLKRREDKTPGERINELVTGYKFPQHVLTDVHKRLSDNQDINYQWQQVKYLENVIEAGQATKLEDEK